MDGGLVTDLVTNIKSTINKPPTSGPSKIRDNGRQQGTQTTLTAQKILT